MITDDEFRLAHHIDRQRRKGVPWKVIMRETGLGRTKLNELRCLVTGGGGIEALGAQIVAAVRRELDRCGRAEVSVNGQTVAVQLDLVVVPPVKKCSRTSKPWCVGAKSLSK